LAQPVATQITETQAARDAARLATTAETASAVLSTFNTCRKASFAEIAVKDSSGKAIDVLALIEPANAGIPQVAPGSHEVVLPI
jgi:hypothetical protein